METAETPKPDEKLTWEQQQRIERERNAAIQDQTRAKLEEVFRLIGFKVKKKDGGSGAWGAEVHMEATHRDMTIYARANGYRCADRVRFSVSFPRPKVGTPDTYGLTYPEATATLEKSALALARDIEHRIIPAYAESMKRAREKNAQQERFHASRNDNLRMILGRRALTKYEKDTGRAMFDHGKVRVDLTVDDSVAGLEFHRIPVKLAARLVALLKKEASAATK